MEVLVEPIKSAYNQAESSFQEQKIQLSLYALYTALSIQVTVLECDAT